MFLEKSTTLPHCHLCNNVSLLYLKTRLRRKCKYKAKESIEKENMKKIKRKRKKNSIIKKAKTNIVSSTNR